MVVKQYVIIGRLKEKREAWVPSIYFFFHKVITFYFYMIRDLCINTCVRQLFDITDPCYNFIDPCRF